MKRRFQKIVAAFLIFGQFAFWPILASAQIFGISTPVTPMYTNDGVSTPALDVPILASIEAASVANQVCLVGDAAATAASTVARVALNSLSVLSGGGSLVATLSAEIAKLQAAIACHQAVLTTLEGILTPDSATSNQKQVVSNSANTAIAALKTKLESVNQQLTVAQGGLWKALLITVLIQTTKSVADQLVNRLVNSYKISNIKAYVDSAATLMYDNQYIRDNFPDAQGQMMARAILTNPAFRNRIQPGMFIMADNSLGYNCAEVKSDDPNFYNKVANCGSAEANPYYLQTAYVSGVDQARALSLATANFQISQGNGYKAPVTCQGSLMQQNQIDLATKAASDRIDNRKALLQSLIDAQTSGEKISSDDIKRAQADVTAAEAAYQNLPFAVTGRNSVSANAVGGGSNTEGSIAIKMCEAISSPAILINQGIDAMFKSISSSMSQYNSNNLPGFLSAIGGMATQIGSRMILGGITGDKSYNINEGQAISQAISVTGAAAIQSAANHVQENLAKGIYFEANPIANVPNGWELSWQVADTSAGNGGYITITGNGVTNGASRLPLTGSYPLTTTTGGTYLLNFYSAAGQILTSATTEIVFVTPQAYNYNPSAGAVAGAFAGRPSINIRGPVDGISPRGPQ